MWCIYEAVSELCVCCLAAEIRPREITPGAFTSPTAFELRFSVEMVEGVVRLTTGVEEVYKPTNSHLSLFLPPLSATLLL